MMTMLRSGVEVKGIYPASKVKHVDEVNHKTVQQFVTK